MTDYVLESSRLRAIFEHDRELTSNSFVLIRVEGKSHWQRIGKQAIFGARLAFVVEFLVGVETATEK